MKRNSQIVCNRVHSAGPFAAGRGGLAMYECLEPAVRRFVDRQHRDAYRLIDAVRMPGTGLYSDAYDTVARGPVRMGSIAATGVGLAGLAVAYAEGWDPAAGEKALATLQSVNQGAAPRDKATGFFYHFHDLETGEVWQGSEISTIDTAILVAGARLAAYHLGTAFPQVKKEAEKLLHSIQWEVAIGDPETGEIYMVIENGRGAGPGRPFTEYAIVASVARDAEPESQRIQEFWRRVYAPDRVEQLPAREYHGVRLLVDSPTSYLSSFVCQFPLYLVPEYALCEAYHRLVQGAAIADRISWQLQGAAPSYVWGHGAGSNEGLPVQDGARPPGYAVDAIGRSSGVASAYIIAGFLPVYPHGIYDLYAWYRLHLPYDSYTNPSDLRDEQLTQAAYRFGLGRFAWEHRLPPQKWYPRLVTVIDWSTMLYGLTAFKRGMAFFALGREAAGEGG